jgi:ribonuclease Z
MPRLKILGSGTPIPTNERWGTAFILEISGESFMVDCGPAATSKMHRMGVSCTSINNLFFTHLHSDHIADYPCFLMTRFDLSLGIETELHVYGPPPIKDISDRLWGNERGVFWYDVVARTKHPMSVGAFHKRGGNGSRPEPVVHVSEYREGKVASGKNWDCYVREVIHAQPFVECYGLRFETTEGIIAFSGDTAPCEAAVELARNADLFVTQAVYLEGALQQHPGYHFLTGTIGAGRMAKEAGAKRLVVTHQSPSLDSSEAISEAIFEIKRAYDGPVYWGKDLMEIIW